MSRAGYADFFPAAPSVLAKKAQAERAAKEKARKIHDEYESGALSAGSTASSSASIPSHVNLQLTPMTSSSSPPEASPGATTAKIDEQPVEAYKELARPTIPTPKATPPASAKPEVLERDCRIEYDPFLDKDLVRRKGKPLSYRYDGEGLLRPVEDPRRSVSDYTKGPKFGKKKLRPALDRIRWTWDEHYIGPGPPSQIMVLNLSPLTTESEILMNFKAFGEIQHFELKTDPATGGSLGVCSIVFRDSKSAKALGHQSAKRAVQQGNDLRLGMQNIRVMLDRDGLKYGKYTRQLLDNKKRKAEEARKKEQEQAARNRPPPTAPHTDAAAAPPWNPPQRDAMSARELNDRFLKPKPPNYKAINELGRRPAVFISSRWIPGEARFCKHLFGRLKNFGVDNILCDRDGFFVVFYNMRGLNSCFRMCDGDRLFSYKMCMKPYPRGNPALGPVSLDGSGTKLGSPHREPVRKLERTRVARETTNEILTDLRTALRSDTIKRVADPCIYDALDPDRLAKRKKTESQGKTDGVTREIAPGTSSVLASIFATHKPPGGRQATITALPRFRKRPARQETPKLAKEARPLAHMLNNYNDASDDESTITEHRPVSRGSASRALSTDIGDDDSASIATSLADIRNRKRKRSHGARTPSRLKDTALETDDEQDEESHVADKVQDDLMDVDEEAGPTVVDDFIAASDEDTESNRKRSKIMEDQGKIEGEDEEVDILGSDSNDLEILRHSEDQWKDDYMQPIIKIDVDNDQGSPAMVSTEPKLSWTISTTDRPRPPVEDDHQVILDLDGLQSMLKDYEDLLFLRRAVEHEPKADIFNVHAWAWKVKEVKATNREGMRGVTHTQDKIEGFYRPNGSGCARTEGYRKIPESEKSMYLPHRLAVAAKRANAPVQPSPSAPRTTNKPVSSSRENRVNNRRLVQELNNQKQILCGDADIMRFNQLKKRKKPVRFARSAIHNWGLYAMENISANDMIIEYVGEIIRQQVADMRERKYIKSGIGSSYLFRIDENTVIDATKKGGIARFINHSCTPNCTAKIIKVEGSKRIVIYAMRDIKENEELTYDYKFERELDSDERIPCLCGSSGCKGFLN